VGERHLSVLFSTPFGSSSRGTKLRALAEQAIAAFNTVSRGDVAYVN